MSRLISDKYREYQQTCQNRFDTLKANEKNSNRILSTFTACRKNSRPTSPIRM